MNSKTPKDKYFIIFDTKIGIWRESAEGDWDTYEAVRGLLVRNGFSFHQDPEIKQRWPSLANTHHCGRKQDLHFKSSLSGRHHALLFFEDVIRDNRYGGQYHFDKLAKMPYLLRKQAELAMRKVRELLLSLGFTDTSEPKFPLAIDHCMYEREKLGLFQGERMYCAGPPSQYNAQDGDGNLLRDGQIKYFWDYQGRLGRGVVFHHINNMWWIVASPHTLLNIASFNIFDWKPGMPLKNPGSAEKKLRVELENAVKVANFERASLLCDVLGRELATAEAEAAQ